VDGKLEGFYTAILEQSKNILSKIVNVQTSKFKSSGKDDIDDVEYFNINQVFMYTPQFAVCRSGISRFIQYTAYNANRRNYLQTLDSNSVVNNIVVLSWRLNPLVTKTDFFNDWKSIREDVITIRKQPSMHGLDKYITIDDQKYVETSVLRLCNAILCLKNNEVSTRTPLELRKVYNSQRFEANNWKLDSMTTMV
jgi:hypothetical protein